MGILLLILKIIGILLLVILFLAVLLVFYPVFYQVEGKIEEKISLHGRISWLFQIVRFEFDMEGSEVKPKIGVLGFRWNLGEEKTKEEESEHSASGARMPFGKKEETEDRKSEDSQMGTKAKKFSEHQKKPEVKEPAENQEEASKEVRKKEKTQKNTDPGWKKRIENIRAEVTNEGNKMAVSHLWEEILYLLMHLKPKYIRAEIDFSAGDPATTGQVTGVLSLLPILYQYDTHIYPDFLSEDFYIRGDFKLRGRMALYCFIRCFVRVWKDKNIRKLYHKIRK